MITLLLTTLGAGGFGSLMKILASFVAQIIEARSIRARDELAKTLALAKADVHFQQAVFGGNNEDSASSQFTRRILAIIGMSTFSAIAVICTLVPDAPFATIPPGTESATGVTLFWGAVSFPPSKPVPTVLTTGHITLMAMTTLSMIMGFYFTPGGRK